LPPAGPVNVLGHAPSGAGPLRVSAYDAEASYTCIQVIPDQRPNDGFVSCVPPAWAVHRPTVEVKRICSAGDGFGYLYGTALRTARQVQIEIAGAAPIQGPAFDGGTQFDRSYWAVNIPNHAKVTQVLALDDQGAVVGRATPGSRLPC